MSLGSGVSAHGCDPAPRRTCRLRTGHRPLCARGLSFSFFCERRELFCALSAERQMGIGRTFGVSREKVLNKGSGPLWEPRAASADAATWTRQCCPLSSLPGAASRPCRLPEDRRAHQFQPRKRSPLSSREGVRRWPPHGPRGTGRISSGCSGAVFPPAAPQASECCRGSSERGLGGREREGGSAREQNRQTNLLLRVNLFMGVPKKKFPFGFNHLKDLTGDLGDEGRFLVRDV